ncbi:hypothetical protein PpBr36_03420 [Pyricularia pennisetigena]|uniref:hypothetical protein n=1 Tax=Pyricularia pennisetigena TaxID=1578925 RepID=UPI001150E27A|nr:hypothetical protein PpBr36_03420 [Pyricularia pennisetigena]TLS30497.1 hypothetical protein PpBr36_03420 [Pyricularia pennisetigena]
MRHHEILHPWHKTSRDVPPCITQKDATPQKRQRSAASRPRVPFFPTQAKPGSALRTLLQQNKRRVAPIEAPRNMHSQTLQNYVNNRPSQLAQPTKQPYLGFLLKNSC